MSTTQPKAQRGEGTLLSSLILSAPGPLVTGIAALTSGSATQLADFIRRTAELLATIVSWWVYRRTGRDETLQAEGKARLERAANLAVTLAMVLAGVAMCVVGGYRFFVPRASGNVLMGLIISALGVLTNSFFWFRYRKLAREEHNTVLAAQHRLYRAKSIVDASVSLALLVIMLFPGHAVSLYVDAVGSIVVGGYMIATGSGKRKRAESPEDAPGKDNV